MNHELAQELKDAGFPGLVTLWRSPDGAQTATGATEGFDQVAMPPTLSELIEACGERFWELGRDGGKWFAHAGPVNMLRAEADTPEEAVAHLWLALNKKV